jgi:hypothetical protein
MPGRETVVGLSDSVVRYQKGLLYLYTPSRAWQRLQELHYKAINDSRGSDPLGVSPRLKPHYAPLAYRYSLACALGQFAVLDPKRQVSMYTSLLDFITATRSFDGLESMLLTALNCHPST